VAVHVGISLVAVFAALRLRRLLSGSRASRRGGIPASLEELPARAEELAARA
jgi:hypothetical protein